MFVEKTLFCWFCADSFFKLTVNKYLSTTNIYIGTLLPCRAREVSDEKGSSLKTLNS